MTKQIINTNDVTFEYMRGKGPGGQHKNKTATMVRATHVPSGCQVVIDGRSQAQNKKEALAVLEQRVHELAQQKKAARRKDARDAKIKERNIIRTYDFKKGIVRDHRSHKTASIKQVLGKGQIELLRPDDFADRV